MSSIISPKTNFVNSGANPTDLSQKSAKMQEKLAAELLEVYGNLTIVFAGTPEFAVPILEELCVSDFKPKAVITAPDRPAGRGQELTPPPIKIIAQKNNLQIFQPQTKQDLYANIAALKPDIILVAAYGKILPAEVIALPKYGSLNVHPSLLPRYRGPSPIQFAILNGDKTTGTTIMLMNEKVDEGAILAQETIEIESSDTARTLEEKLSKISARLLVKTINSWLILKEMPQGAQQLVYPQEQDHSIATYTKIISKEDGHIIWDKTASEIERQVRAFTPWPTSFTFFTARQNALSLKILKADISDLQTDKALGEVFITSNQQIAIQTGNGCLIVEHLQLEGGKPMPANEFLNGHPEFIGTILK